MGPPPIAKLLRWRRVALFLQNYFHLRLVARDRIDFRFVGLIPVKCDFQMMLSGSYQHGMKSPPKIAAMTHVTVVDKYGCALGQDIQSQLGRIAPRISYFGIFLEGH